MRLFEVAGNQFQDDLVSVLKVMQGRANTQRTQSVVTWPAINNMMAADGYSGINDSIVSKIRDQIDPTGDLIQDINEKGIVLKTNIPTPEDPAATTGGPNPKSVDQMAHNVVSKDL